jgi:anti-anti-sigma factor
MQVKTTKLGVATYLAPAGALIEENLGDLAHAAGAARDQGALNLVLDLKRVPVFDSFGLEFILDLARGLQEEGGSLRLAAPTPLAREVLAITRLDRMLSVYEDLESAGRSFL